MSIKLTKKDIITICRWHGFQCAIGDDYGKGVTSRKPYVHVWKEDSYSEVLGCKWDIEYCTMPEIVQLLGNVVLTPVEKSETPDSVAEEG